MLYSKSYITTLKETPRDAEIVSHQLMLRAGLIRKSAVGLYTWMPLGKRVLDKAIAITKQEMDRAGALEILPPFVTSGELWKESGRWVAMGKELLRFKDRHEHDYVLGPTHEEAFMQIVRETAQSYQDFPVNLYQINTKFRDEIRPRYGMIRCREFIMKDAYSFDIDDTGLDKSYQDMKVAYIRTFSRMGLNFDIVLADSGNIGGTGSEEFMVPSAIGESDIIHCKCGYVANADKADSRIPVREPKPEKELVKFYTPDTKTIEDLATLMKCETKDPIKSFVVEADSKFVMAVIRGDLQINEVKLQSLIGAVEMRMADPDAVWEEFKIPAGYFGAIDCPLDVYVDDSIIDMNDSICGANEPNMHYSGVSVKRDFKITKVGHFHLAEAGHECPECGQALESYKGIEVGHIFKLGKKYTESMDVTVLDKNNQELIPTCGCYGIGMGRAISAIVEQGADENGIVFPVSLAPYHVTIVPTSIEGELFDEAMGVYNMLLDNQVETMLDDRDERPGVKFKDADLIGIPLRITVGKSWQEQQKFELKFRHSGEILLLSKDEVVNTIKTWIAKEFDSLNNVK